MALGSLGSYAGVTVLPFVLNLVLELRGLNAAFIFFGSLCCSTVLFGSLLPSRSSTGNPQNCKEKLAFLEEDALSDSEEDLVIIHSDSISERPLIKSTGTKSSESVYSRHKGSYVRIHYVLLFIYIIVSSLRRIPSGVWTMFLIPYVKENGLSVDESILAGTLGGVGGVVGRFLAALSFKVPRVHPIETLAFYVAILGLSFLGFELFLSKQGQLLFSFVSGLLISTPAAMVTGVLRLLVSHERFSIAFTILEISTGIFSLFSGFIAGW